MNSKSKPTKVGSAARKRPVKSPGRRARRVATIPDAWEQTAQAPDDRDDEIDCQRIVQGDGRSLPSYYDDYN